MITSSSTADDASGPSLVWVESMGGPLIVVPVSALASWGGCTESGLMAGDAPRRLRPGLRGGRSGRCDPPR
ncbi:Imm21 family immunity protein [Streptomyces sp. QHH-9511]|uniref:Imm21 family immunity protein n=1 Tax=Streptomyces sp. QHH-9511 TaxID=2684468 RepID=UPI002FCD5C51